MKDKDKKPETFIIVTHHQAGRDYLILDSLEAGMVLVGCEVKSLRDKKADLTGSFARFEGDELFLYGLYIAPYPMGNRENPEPKRPRKLLLRRSQMRRIKSQIQEKGLTMIPLKLYFNARGIAKVDLGVAKGKNVYDRRADIKKRSAEREIDRAVKNRNRKG
jgi:SsrA-binding protein